MSSSPNSLLLQRTIDLNLTNKKRSQSLKWIIVNAVFLLVFVYDLSCKCPGYTSILHYVELLCAGVLAANLIQYTLSLAPSREPKLPLSPQQQKLLGLSSADLDSSFILTKSNVSGAVSAESSCSGEPWVGSDADLSLSPRVWRSAPPSPPSPPVPAPCTPPSPVHRDSTHDQFIADRESLANYLRRCDERSAAAAAEVSPTAPRGAPPPYQLSAVDSGVKLEEGSPQGSPQPWWRLDLDPQRLTQWNLNLRLWIQVTILEPVVRELAAADEALSRAALLETGALLEGRSPPGRLRALAALRPPPHPPLAALLPFLEPFADLRYVVRRLRELAKGGCLSEYKWNAGGSEWEPSKPTDAELVLHLFATYLDGQLAGGGGARPFSAEHVLERSAVRRPGRPGVPAVVRVSARPPHYALALGSETLEVGRGRNNLLHALLLLLAAAARLDPPALGRTSLGRAGLNMLWIIGRDR
ncbi:transmembrane protein 209 [Danaus plexippus]|uniref:transmembrane protein 209 n=1 Tax=Danaus plexippus TaxID=13037 RepID=UPI002AB13A23|nr:transmembrane protein 209 [Danaus plexippus]